MNEEEVLQAILDVKDMILKSEDRLGKRIDDVEKRLGKRIDDVEERLGKRIDKLEAKTDDIGESMAYVKIKVSQHDEDIFRLKKRA